MRSKERNEKNKPTKKKEGLGPSEVENQKNTKIPENELFSYQSIFNFSFGGCPKFPFLRTWPKNRTPKKTP